MISKLLVGRHRHPAILATHSRFLLSTHNYASHLHQEMQAALADLAKQDTPNYMATSKRTGIPRKTLSDRFTELHGSQQTTNSESRQCLNDAQEEALIQLINRLTNRGLPPTNSIMRNLAEEIIGHQVGKNWSDQFIRRYRDRLTSRYLNNINKKC